MHIINVTVRDKIATHVGDVYYVCGNSDFVVHFDFDAEWDALDVKTARFICEDGSFRNQVFSGNECPVPIISNTNNIRVGVFAGNLCTTTPARVPAAKSILCPGGMPAAPDEDAYHQVMKEMAKVGHEARSSAEASAQSAQEAATSAQEAAQAATSAGTYLDGVDTNAKAATAAAQAAKQSETAAASSAESAEKAKAEAISNADDAEEAAKSAQSKAQAAGTLATQAADSASSAATSAKNAAESAQAAKQSETEAGASAQTASESAAAADASARKAAQAAGNSALYTVNVTWDETRSVWVSDRTQEEIAEASAAGKACMLLDPLMGHVMPLVGFRDTAPQFVLMENDATLGLLEHRAVINTDKTVDIYGTEVKANPPLADLTVPGFLRWNGDAWEAATIDQLKADLGLA